MKVICNRDCTQCTQLNTKTDDNGRPWGYDCLKYDDSVFRNEFKNTKEFEIVEERKCPNV